MSRKGTRTTPSSLDRCKEYAKAVVRKETIAGPYVRGECARFLDDLVRKDIWFDVDAADRVFNFFGRLLRFSEGQFAGKPFELSPPQAFIMGNAFGWKRRKMRYKKDDPRRFQRFYIEQGKGNGKTPMAAGIALYGVCADGEGAAEVYIAASTRDQAMVCFRDVHRMAMSHPKLKQRLTILGSQTNPRKVVYLPNASFIEPLSRNVKVGGSGPRPHVVILDELHEHPDGGALEVLERGLKFRKQPMIWMLTNSGHDRMSVCYEEHELACRIAMGQVEQDDEFTFVCSLDEKDNAFTDPTCWEKANPMLNEILGMDYLARQVETARHIPSRSSRVRRWHFCEWVEAEEAWIEPELWDACEAPELTWEDFKDRRCYAGLDLSATTDMTVLAVVGEDGYDDDGQIKLVSWIFAFSPAETLAERSRFDRVDYERWAEDGYLHTVPGRKIRYEYVVPKLLEVDDHTELISTCYDRYAIASFQEALDDAGGSSIQMHEHPQGFAHRKREGRHDDSPDLFMPRSIDELETMILEKRIRFQFNPVLRLAASGAQFRINPTDLVAWDKRKATARIDAIVALTMAVGLANQGRSGNPWEDEKFTILEK